MTSLTFFDANAAVGRPRNESLYEPVGTPEALAAYLAMPGVEGALIWHWAQAEGHPQTANPLLEPYRAVSHRVRTCLALLPPATREQEDIEAILSEGRVSAFRLFPQHHRYLMNRVVWGDVLDRLSDQGVPVLLSLEQGATWPDVYGILADYPRLTCILCDIGTWSMDRYTYPLLETYPNVVLETGMLALEDGGVESVVRRFGAGRLVFGTGYPKRYAEAAMLQLSHADLREEERQAIASENLERLLKETRQ